MIYPQYGIYIPCWLHVFNVSIQSVILCLLHCPDGIFYKNVLNAVFLFSIISDALRFKIVFKSLFQIGFVDLISPLDVYCIVCKNPSSCGSNDSCLSPFCVSQDKRLFNFPLQTNNMFP